MSDNKESQVLNKSLDDGVKNDSQIKQKENIPLNIIMKNSFATSSQHRAPKTLVIS